VGLGHAKTFEAHSPHRSACRLRLSPGDFTTDASAEFYDNDARQTGGGSLRCGELLVRRMPLGVPGIVAAGPPLAVITKTAVTHMYYGFVRPCLPVLVYIEAHASSSADSVSELHNSPQITKAAIARGLLNFSTFNFRLSAADLKVGATPLTTELSSHAPLKSQISNLKSQSAERCAPSLPP